MLDWQKYKIIIYFAFQSTFKMKKDYQKDISDIREMMQRSSRFISLSGLSGIMAGIYALIAASIAYKLAYTFETIEYTEVLVRNVTGKRFELILIALLTLTLTVITGIVLTKNKAKKQNLPSWDQSTQKVIINLLIPLVTGGILILCFISMD